MRKELTRRAHLIVAAAAAIISLTMCTKALTETCSSTYELSVRTDSAGAKSGMEPSETGYNSVWDYGDKMQIYIDNVSSSGGNKYILENRTSGRTANFTGTVGSNEGGHTVYGFCPAGALLGENGSCTVTVDLPYNQNPTLASFDPGCDLLAAQPMNVTFKSGQSASVDNARFARQLAILKVVPVDKTDEDLLAEDKVLSLRLTALDNTTLSGRAHLDLQNSVITDWTSQSARNYVTAGYDSDDAFVVNGSNAAFLMVRPCTLESGSDVRFQVNTDSHLLTKDITLTSDINIPAGRITTLKVKMDNSCVESAGAALPFLEDFSSITTGKSTSTDSSGVQWNGNDNIPTVIKTYQAGGSVKLGTGSSTGSITTRMLNLAEPFTVSFKVKGWTTVEGDITVTAGSQSRTVTYTSVMSGSFEQVTVPFYAESSICCVSIATTSKRCFIDDVSVISGKEKEHAIICTDRITVSAAAEGTSCFTVTSDYGWTASASKGALFSFSPGSGSEGKSAVTVTASSSNTTYSSRELGTITFSDGSVSKKVTVCQNGAPDPSAKGWAELPAASTGDDLELCRHSTLPSNAGLRNYSFLFDKTRHCSLWVAWPLHACYMGDADRTNGFGYDPDFISNEYEADLCGAYYPQGGSSYSHARGHQMPSAERTASEEDNLTTFYATNMTPQLQNFNGCVWEELERMERETFVCSDTLYIVSGPYFDPEATPAYSYDKKGKGKACQVPTHYWKIFLRTKSGDSGKAASACSASELQCVGFWFKHEARNGLPKASDMKSVSEIESLTGFNFFPNVPNAPKDSFSASDWGL